ncbi:unnamed protein product [Amoebophrya sp. A25]|nr:unnamed protein product [Amoebophrya sp. A25]|eukprot:GSA25T00004455001.1
MAMASALGLGTRAAGALAPPTLNAPTKDGPNPFSQFRLGGNRSGPVVDQQAVAMQSQAELGVSATYPVPVSMSGAVPASASSASAVRKASHPQSSLTQQQQIALQMQQQNLAVMAGGGGPASASSNRNSANGGGVGSGVPAVREQVQVVPAPQVSAPDIDLRTMLRDFSQTRRNRLALQLRKLCDDDATDAENELFSKIETLVAARVVASGNKFTLSTTPTSIPFPAHSKCNLPPFFWQPSTDYEAEFSISGEHSHVVTKVKDFEDKGWVIPVSGSLRMVRGGVYKWTLHIVTKCHHRPQMQFGIHGENHEKPWRLVTTSRCSRSRDDDPWRDRPGGDKLIDEGDYVTVIVDLRSTPNPETQTAANSFGKFLYAVNDEAPELVFDDLPLTTPLMPVVSMGGDACSIELVY